ncbi:GAF domain-containing protein [Microbacterium sp. X-17]|uniref:sensor histidine kinase n=1 Tax=Microbacterium sp. X-17 TaxID=3144404 RepID=UPI0031F55FC1
MDPLPVPDESPLELDDAFVTLLAQTERASTQRRLRALLAGTQALVEERDLPTVLRRVVEVACSLVDAEYGAMGVIAPERDHLEEFVYVGLGPEQAARIGDLPTGHGLLGALITDPRPIRLPEIAGDPRAGGFPPHHPRMDSFLGVPVRVRGEVFGNLYLTNRRDGEFTEEDEQLVAALATTAGFAIENARLLDRAKAGERWMSAAAELSAALLSTSTDTAYDLVANRVRELTNADLVCVLLTDDDEERLRVVAARGTNEDSLHGAVIASRQVAAVEDVLRTGEPCSLPREPEDADDPLRVCRDGEAGPILAVPLRTRSRLWGALSIARDPTGRGFRPEDRASASDLASRTTIALELAAAREAQQRSLLADDRRRIARDLHDQVIQQLFGSGLSLQALAGSLENSADRERIAEVVEQIDGSISQIRTAIFALSQRDESSLRHRVLDVVTELSSALAHPPAVRFGGPVDHAIVGELAADVVAVTRELLSNAIRHAHAGAISLEVAVVDGWASVHVEDDGVGLGGATRRSGLANLSERAEALGGQLVFGSPEPGTSVRWRVPLRVLGERRKEEQS